MEATPATALVYNRSPATYKHRDLKTGKVTVVPPGGSAVVPATVADNWARVSSGLVTTAVDQTARLSNAAQLLAEEKLKTARLTDSVKSLTDRLAKLEQRQRGT